MTHHDHRRWGHVYKVQTRSCEAMFSVPVALKMFLLTPHDAVTDVGH